MQNERLPAVPPRPGHDAADAVPTAFVISPAAERRSHRDESVLTAVSLPPLHSRRSGNAPSRSSGRQRRPVPTPGGAVRNGGTAATSTPPVPPPRPASTITSRTRDLPPPAPRVPPTPVASEAASLSLPLSPAPPVPVAEPPVNISLSTPRPGLERAQNLYVDAPLKAGFAPSPSPVSRRPSSPPLPQSTHGNKAAKKGSHSFRLIPNSPSSLSSTVITNTPSSSAASTLKKPKKPPHDFPSTPSKDFSSLSDPSSAFSSLEYGHHHSSSSDDETSSNAAEDSIICRSCGRCRCAACRTPRPLPDRWLCGGACHLSAETVVETASCLWLVKAALYHLGKDLDDADSPAKNGCDHPCSCSASHGCARWTCLGAASLVLPCLCCYWPMKMCARGAEKAYQRATANGCRCDNRAAAAAEKARQAAMALSASAGVGPVIQDQPTSLTLSSAPSSPGGGIDEFAAKRRDACERKLLS